MLFLLFSLLQLFSVLQQITLTTSSPLIANPNCTDICGDVSIPYPFGIGPNCYHNKSYEIYCDTASSQHQKPILKEFNLVVMDIIWEGKNPRVYNKYQSEIGGSSQVIIVGTAVHSMCKPQNSINLAGSPYRFSSEFNVLKMIGCGGRAVMKDGRGNFLSGCASICDSGTGEGCFGLGCCYTSSNNLHSRQLYQLDIENEPGSSPCNMSVGYIDINSASMDKFDDSIIPTVLEWDGPASYVQAYSTRRYDSNFHCESSVISSPSATCWCSSLYEGNPYLPNGCQVIRECRKCINRCEGSDADENRRRFHCSKSPLLRLGSLLGFTLGLGLMITLLGCFWLYRTVKKKREVQRRSEYFKRNGGLLLQKRIGFSEEASQITKVFSIRELEKATDNFNKNRILGQGGQGTVYKGMLKDGRIVAIKKSKQVDESQLEQFVNEVVILTQINHRNVVKLLGCCLETEVPMLIYEFILNGTLYQHIHDASEDFHLTWEMRLQMAAESADAIAYLHSSSSAPIYHRDIKSANILLDSKFAAKVSDFGTSKTIDIEQTHVTTVVMGTYGYLDPEYFQSNQFTEKSDVYSFGVVLVELITGKKPICPSNDGGWTSLAVEFLSHMEDSRLFNILDNRVLNEDKEEEFVAVAKLATQCLNMNGKERPTMKEVAMELNKIRSSKVTSSKEPESVERGMIKKMNDDHGISTTTNNYFSDIGPSTSTIEVQRFMAHTF